MKTNTFTPDHYELTYVLNQEKKTFRQYLIGHAEIPLLTDLIRIEKNNGFNSITGAENLLRIRNSSNWCKCTLTGLRSAGTPNYYYADLPIKGVKSLCVILYNPHDEVIRIKVTPQFYPVNKGVLGQIVNGIIKTF